MFGLDGASAARVLPGLADHIPGLADHIYVFLIIGVFPLYSFLAYLIMRRRLGDDLERAANYRRRVYRASAYWLVTIALVAVGLWLVNGRPLADLGLSYDGSQPQRWALYGVGAFAAAQAMRLIWLVFDRRRDADYVAAFERVRTILPHTGAEYRFTLLLSMIAGVTEEIVFRGYLIWYAGAFAPLVVAVFAAAFVFALAHAYQGGEAAAKIGGAALLFSALYLATGSLLAPMAAHVVIDLTSFTAARIVLRRNPNALSAPPSAPHSEP